MRKYLVLAVFSGLCVMMVSGPAPAGQSFPVGVQTDSKRDNLFLTELPETIGTWTNRCLEKERISAQAALVCWRDAAIAVEIYTSALSTPLQEQLHELQLAWTQRVAQLQSLASSHDRTAQPSSVSAANVEKVNVPIPRRKAEVQQKKTIATSKRSKKPGQIAKAGEITVVPAAAEAKTPRLKKQASKKFALRAAETEKSPAKKRSSSREAEIQAIREELKLIAKKLECCT
jgi:hypothetical protein